MPVQLVQAHKLGVHVATNAWDRVSLPTKVLDGVLESEGAPRVRWYTKMRRI